MTEKDFLRISIEDGVALVTIDRPPLNILGFSQYENLCETVIHLIETRQARAVVLTGTKKAFISGLNISEILKITTSEENNEKTLRIKNCFRKVEQLRRPVIAAIDGNCFGGGLELSISCHIRIASKEAKLAVPEINLGTIPSFGGTQRLPRILGRAKALELILTGKLISGEEAFHIGLVNEVCPSEELLARATDLARQIASKSPQAVEAATRAATEGLEMEFDRGIELESHVSSALTGTYNLKEGITSFFERRKPAFRYD
jgi:enoyl-CoA hydratase/carnithine racemase